jgi:hypothetical protein
MELLSANYSRTDLLLATELTSLLEWGWANLQSGCRSKQKQ